MPGYKASSIASSGVGRNGDPTSGGESILVAVRFDCVPFDVDGIGTSVFTLLLRFAIFVQCDKVVSQFRGLHLKPGL